MKDTIIYDQPLNEIIRVCLRLEQLFLQIDHQLNDGSTVGTRNIIHLIINVLHILDRPDLKAKLAKELSHFLTQFMRYGSMPEIDADKLSKLTQELEKYSRSLIASSGKIGYRLRDIELLNSLRLHLASPGGGCSFDIPLFHHWLQQPEEIRFSTIKNWLKDFEQIKTIIFLVLDLVRKNSKIEHKKASSGFHQELLDPQANLKMIRIGIDPAQNAYPEVSLGRHLLSVRFLTPDIDKRPVQSNTNTTFWIAYCNT